VLALELFGRDVATWPDLILAVAALVTAVAGLLAGIAAYRRSRSSATKTAEEDCLERLKVARAEAEAVALELHDRRMREALGE
jgi:hypothetical protein